MARFYCCLIAYAVALALLLPKLSLWLDEILDLIGARAQTLSAIMDYVRMTPGAVPLGYFAQAVAIRTSVCRRFLDGCPPRFPAWPVAQESTSWRGEPLFAGRYWQCSPS
jgi:hypothetical protein